MKTLYSSAHTDQIISRIDALEHNMPALWGRMSPSDAVLHLGDQLRVAVGELEASVLKSTFVTKHVLKPLFLYLLPWPKGKIKTVPEMLISKPTNFESDKEGLKKLVSTFAERAHPEKKYPHPIFGMLSAKEWAVLSYRHLDHHLCQFGV